MFKIRHIYHVSSPHDGNFVYRAVRISSSYGPLNFRKEEVKRLLHKFLVLVKRRYC